MTTTSSIGEITRRCRQGIRCGLPEPANVPRRLRRLSQTNSCESSARPPKRVQSVQVFARRKPLKTPAFCKEILRETGHLPDIPSGGICGRTPRLAEVRSPEGSPCRWCSNASSYTHVPGARAEPGRRSRHIGIARACTDMQSGPVGGGGSGRDLARMLRGGVPVQAGRRGSPWQDGGRHGAQDSSAWRLRCTSASGPAVGGVRFLQARGGTARDATAGTRQLHGDVPTDQRGRRGPGLRYELRDSSPS